MDFLLAPKILRKSKVGDFDLLVLDEYILEFDVSVDYIVKVKNLHALKYLPEDLAGLFKAQTISLLFEASLAQFKHNVVFVSLLPEVIHFDDELRTYLPHNFDFCVHHVRNLFDSNFSV